jgi:hypothetical protein
VLISAEIRWFWRNDLPLTLDTWFCDRTVHGHPAGGGQSRTDAYMLDVEQRELGLKNRGDQPGVEVKGLIGPASASLDAPPFSAPIELWGKWTSKQLSLGASIAIEKQRWLRKFDATASPPVEIPLNSDERATDGGGSLPKVGCNVELTRILTPSREVWWTLGFEAFGPLDSVEASLHAVARHLATRKPPQLTGGRVCSYPTWLSENFRNESSQGAG